MDTPPSVEWVKARADCSLGFVFKELERGVKRDVEAANEASTGKLFSFTMSSDSGSFSVTRSSSAAMPLSVEFRLKQERIEVSGDVPANFAIGLTLNNEGRCMVTVNGTELEQWHVRKMALEDLFFGTGGRPMPRITAL